MKKLIITSVLAAMAAIGSTIMAQDYPDEYLGLPGDNLNLYAVMNLFQNSETLEGFERSLNDENSRINNLDLNGDNLIDYIRVNDYVDGNVHTIVLQAVLGRNDVQDVAVFTVERFRDGSVQIQLIGDELLYGKNYIIEPIYAETPNPGYTGNRNRNNVTVVRTTYVEVATWPVIRFIFLPNYVIWRSSWHWGYYPHYWNPWRPYYWHYYYGYHYHWYPDYYRHYHRWHHHRYAHWNDFYYHGVRAHSQNVSSRISSGSYKETYSRPESRRDGEALYAKVHPERASNISSGSNASRRPASGTTTRSSSGTATDVSRRSSTTVTGRSGSGTSGTQSTGTSRRSSTTVIKRTETNKSTGEEKSGSRRPEASVNTRSNVNSPAGQNTEVVRRTTSGTNERKGTATTSSGQYSTTSRRSTPTVSERSENRPETTPRSVTVRSSNKSPVTASSSNRRSNMSGNKETVIRQGTSKKDSDRNETSRRK